MIPALLIMMLSVDVISDTSFAACLQDTWDMRSRSMVRMLMFGYCSLMVLATASILEGVREARMRRAGDCEAMDLAIADPMLSGLTPVMRTAMRSGIRG